MATREPPVELFYDPEELRPDAPRLYVRKDAGGWELRDDAGVRLASHATLPAAVDDALARSSTRFSEILVRAASGSFEWSVHHNPEWLDLARALAADGASWPASLQAAMAADDQRLTFDPGEVQAKVPKLHVRREGNGWEVRSAAGVMSTHATQEEALASARGRAAECGAEVFFESRSGRFLHRVARSPAELRFLEVWQNIYDDHHGLQDPAAG